jgi:hypothetical protein
MFHTLLDNAAVLLLLMVLGLLFSIKKWPEWIHRALSRSWPTVSGTIESGEVSTIRGRAGRETADATIGYSYTLNGTYYSGYHIETFHDEQAAWSYVDGLKGRSVQVSCNPRRPEISVLRV